MGNTISKSTRFWIVSAFSIAAFSAAGYGSFYLGTQNALQADTPTASSSTTLTQATSSPTIVASPTASATSDPNSASVTTLASTTTAATPTDPNATPSPTVSPSPQTSPEVNPLLVGTTSATPAALAPAITPAAEIIDKPFYTDMRYIILIVDALFVTGLIMTLTLRLLNRVLVAEAPGQSTGEAKAINTDKHPTIDQLDLDIPL